MHIPVLLSHLEHLGSLQSLKSSFFPVLTFVQSVFWLTAFLPSLTALAMTKPSLERSVFSARVGVASAQ